MQLTYSLNGISDTGDLNAHPERFYWLGFLAATYQPEIRRWMAEKFGGHP
jgi:hypothetical protein